jgi:hypothetical protein
VEIIIKISNMKRRNGDTREWLMRYANLHAVAGMRFGMGITNFEQYQKYSNWLTRAFLNKTAKEGII